MKSACPLATQARPDSHQHPPLCVHHLRGRCRFGATCKFSHDEACEASPPFHDRQYVPSQVPAAPVPRWRFRVMSYNVLADGLARDHAGELYRSIQPAALEWRRRGRMITQEILHYGPDVVCLQEVDHFSQFDEELGRHGYSGVFTKRTGDRCDGLAMFWKQGALRPVAQQVIKFDELALKDNVAQLVAFERATMPQEGQPQQSNSSPTGGLVVVTNIHVLFSPKRSDLKLGQIRTLMERVNSLCLQQWKLDGQQAACVLAGDFNSAAGSPIYDFMIRGELDLTQHDRRKMSGQVESSRGKSWRDLQQGLLARQHQTEGLPGNAGLLSEVRQAASGGAMRPWGPEDLRIASGNSNGSVARHPLRIDSAYRAVTGAEPIYTTCHDKFIGTVDFLWYSCGSGLVPVGVWQPPPLQTLHSALPSLSWPSDHISLIGDFEL